MHGTSNHERVQIAVIPFRKQQGKLEILMISTRKEKRWTVPKRFYSGHNNLQKAAAITVLHEAGLKGRLSTSSIGTFIYLKKDSPCRVHVFVMEVDKLEKKWPQRDRKRHWTPLSKATKQVKEEQLSRLLRKLPNFLLEAELRELLEHLPSFKRII